MKSVTKTYTHVCIMYGRVTYIYVHTHIYTFIIILIIFKEQ